MPISDRFTAGLVKELRGWSSGPLLTVDIVATPSPSHRPIVGRHGSYYAKSYQEYHSASQAQIAAARTKGRRQEATLEGPLGVVVETRCLRPRTSKLAHPRGDVDNFAKCPLDAATKAGLWGDDSQIAVLGSVKRWAAPDEQPGCTLYVGKLKDIA